MLFGTTTRILRPSNSHETKHGSVPNLGCRHLLIFASQVEAALQREADRMASSSSGAPAAPSPSAPAPVTAQVEAAPAPVAPVELFQEPVQPAVVTEPVPAVPIGSVSEQTAESSIAPEGSASRSASICPEPPRRLMRRTSSHLSMWWGQRFTGIVAVGTCDRISRGI